MLALTCAMSIAQQSRATQSYLEGEHATRLATMAKLNAGRLAREVSDACRFDVVPNSLLSFRTHMEMRK